MFKANSVLPALGIHCQDSVQFHSPRGSCLWQIVSSQPWAFVQFNSPRGLCSKPLVSSQPWAFIVRTVSNSIAPEVPVYGQIVSSQPWALSGQCPVPIAPEVWVGKDLPIVSSSALGIALTVSSWIALEGSCSQGK